MGAGSGAIGYTADWALGGAHPGDWSWGGFAGSVAFGAATAGGGRYLGGARAARARPAATAPPEPSYAFNMVENPGPLATMRGTPAANFAGGKYNATALQEDVILYRGGEAGKPLGQWFTREPPASVANVRIDSAVKPQWIDPQSGVLTGSSPIEAVHAIRIPAGTTIYEGPVGYQGGPYLGGQQHMQVFVPEPWKIPGVTPVSATPIR